MSVASEPGFLGTGWGFPIGPPAGASTLTIATGVEAVRQSIWMVLGTAPGERVMRPEFGCRLHDLVFAANDAGTAGAAVEAVRDALNRWEPRIDVLDVTAAPDPDDRNRLMIEINYQVRATNSRYNLVYPFYVA
jgi:phage baseplate assembly protein W